jgi:hypothetical protein
MMKFNMPHHLGPDSPSCEGQKHRWVLLKTGYLLFFRR